LLGHAARSRLAAGLRHGLRIPYWLATLQIARRLEERRLARRIDASGLFDAAFYTLQYPDLPAGSDPVLHYVVSGAAEGRDPNPAFDTAAYLAAHPEAAATGCNPLIHYLDTQHRAAGARVRPDWTAIAPVTAELRAAVRATLRAAAEAADGLAPAIPAFSTPADPRVSVLIRVGQDPTRLARCLRTLGQHLGGVASEVVLVGRAGPAIEDLAKGAGLAFIDAGTRPSSAWPAMAARGARGSHLVILDDFIVVLPGWLEAMLETFERFPLAGAVGACHLHADGGSTAGGIIHSDGNLEWRGEKAPVGHHDFASVQEADFCPLSALAVPAAVWASVSGIDESFATTQYGAADFAVRLRAAGHRILYQPFSRVAAVEPRQDDTVAQLLDDRSRFAARWCHAPGSGESASGPVPWLWPSRARPRALFVDQLTPTPDKDAGSALVRAFMAILQGWDYEVTFAAAYSLEPAGRYTDDLRRSGFICVSTPFEEDAAAFLEKEAAGFDLVIFWRTPVASRFISIIRRHAPAVKVVFHTVDLHYLREERQAMLSDSRKLMTKADRTRDLELDTIRDADCTILVSSHEAEVIGSRLPNAKTRVIPLIIDVPGRLAPLEGRQDVVFIGGFRHQPNIDAVLFLATEVWPLVHLTLPSARLIVIGGNPPEEIQRLQDAGKGIEIRGWVEDLTETLRHCRLTVAPLRFGAGVKGKIATSLAYGVPCVATPVAVEGMGLEPGHHLMVAEQAPDLARAIIQVYGDPQLWHSLSDSGLDFARRNFSVESVSMQVREMLADLGLPAGRMEARERPEAASRPAPAMRMEWRAEKPKPAPAPRSFAMARPAPSHRISVVVPLYNHERYIEQTLQSALSQTLPVHEIVVVDDGSSDASVGLVDRLRERHPQITLWSKENGGAHSAINAGIERATGDLIAILNSDDIYHPDRLAVILRAFDGAPETDAAVTGLDFIDADGRALRNPWYEDGVAFHRRTRDLALTLVNGNIFMTTSNLVARRSLFAEVGGFSALRYAHDLDFFLRLVARGKTIRVIDQPLLSYRQHPANTIKEGTLKVKAEWAVAVAFFLDQLWGQADRGATDWSEAGEFLAVLDHHGLTASVLLCMAYFHQHPSKSLENSSFHEDEAFRARLAELLR
jgi:GT2 family glycosyltransferase/glycosyltransferase involved in cell wall biosynthesis